MIQIDPQTGQQYVEFDGVRRYLSAHLPTELRFGSYPTWTEAGKPLFKEEELEECGDEAWLQDTYDQNGWNSCTGDAMAGAFGAAWAMSGQKPIRFSHGFAYAHNNGGMDRGAFCRNLVEFVRDNGLSPESACPRGVIFKGQIPAEAYKQAPRYRISEVYQCLNWQEVFSAPMCGYVVYHGFLLGNSFKPDSEGFVPDWDGSYSGGHAMFTYGLKKHRSGKMHGKVKNSWGNRFGENGVSYIPPSYFWSQRGNFINLDAWAFKAVVEDPQNPDPLPIARD